MKKLKAVFSIFLLVVFLSTTSGIQVYKHYCGDFLAAVSLFHKSNPCMDDSGKDACAMKKEMSCCDDEFEFIQLDVDLQKVLDQQFDFHKITALKVQDTFFSFDSEPVKKALLANFEGPPQINQLPLYQLFHSLTFYG